MTCLRENEHGADLLIGFLEDTLPEAQRRELLAHASVCQDCRELLAVQDTLDDYEAPEVSPAFDARLYARIEADRRPWWSLAGWQWALPAGVAAMLAVGVWIRQPEPGMLDDGQKQASFDRQELQQLEQALDDLDLLLPAAGTDVL